jgi:thiosulfate/3-mercaptopyruvate sulfurtransferase
MGFQDVMLYENSWFEWGSPDNFYPVETKANIPSSNVAIPSVPGGTKRPQGGNAAGAPSTGSGSAAGSGGSDGYISCGG